MAQVPSKMPPPLPHTGKSQEPKAGQVGLSSADGYVRIEIHVEDGQLSIIGVKQVPGPLVMSSTVIRGYAYEVLLDEQQVSLGSVPDVGIRRAFANRDVEGPQSKHYFINVPAFDFFVRIPKGNVSAATLSKLNIVLHKVEEAPDRLNTLAALQKQPGVKSVEIGRLAGITLEQLPPAVRPHLEQILRETDELR